MKDNIATTITTTAAAKVENFDPTILAKTNDTRRIIYEYSSLCPLPPLQC